MPAYHPRSIVSLILVGFGVVLTPFVIAVVTAVVQVDRFAGQSRTAVLSAGSATEDSRSLVEQLTEMQRALGQFVVRGDPEYFEIYLDRREDFRSALANLIDADLDGIDAASLEALAADESSAFERFGSQAERLQGGNWEPVIAELETLRIEATEILQASDRLVQDSANQVTARAESLQRTLLVMAAAAVPVTVVLVVLFTVLITRPMRALGLAIRRLGARSLDEPIAVSGPEDIESLSGELEWLRQRINSLEEQKSTFLQHISHELKTPLTTIREGSELLTETLGGQHSEEADIARLLQASGIQLQQIIEDLLEFAKTQELAVDLRFEPAVDLRALVEGSIAALAVLSDAKEIAVESRLDPVFARCDSVKIGTVLDNLLTNAIKFTPESGRIGIRLAADSENARIDVCDSGPGVAADEREGIFEPFRQGSADYESSVKGTGLGLSIAREYVAAHGGTIGLVDSVAGAHFRVVLPLAGPESVHGKE